MFSDFKIDFDEYARYEKCMHLLTIAYMMGIVLYPGPKPTDNPNHLKNVCRVWNGAFATFSAVAFLWSMTQWRVALWPTEDAAGPLPFFAIAYAFSKPAEFGDTVLLMLRRKEVRLIHWSHHVITLLFTWDLLVNRVKEGIFFALVNLFVHSIMYSYYFLVSFEALRKPLMSRSHFITQLQILQFIVCIVFTVVRAPALGVRATAVAITMYAYYGVMFDALRRKKIQ